MSNAMKDSVAVVDPIYVTKTFLPPLDEYIDLLREVWDTHLVTNDGPLYGRFEEELRVFTGIPHLACVANGTLALQIALRALDIHGDVITTPFTHVATSDCLVWEGCNPVFVDIDPETLNIDPDQIEENITENTKAILPVHVYSNPCDVERIGAIAQKHGLKVIYDGAHAFGATYDGASVFVHGDLAMASFNATKGFHTIEGGALFAHDEKMIERIRKLAYYGMNERKEITQPYGTNAKLIEFCAAMGLVNLRYFPDAIARRQDLYRRYVTQLKGNRRIEFQKLSGDINFSYMPVLLQSEYDKRTVVSALNSRAIFPREYFHPSLETVFCDHIRCPIAYDLSRRVLCLPMSDYLDMEQVTTICEIINAAI